MHTCCERTVSAVLACALAMILCGCGGSSTTSTTVTTTTTNADGSTTTVTTSGGSTSGGATAGGSTSGGSTSFAVGGSVSGLGSNESVTLLDNGGDAVAVSSDGAFVFPTRLGGGGAYAVTVQSHTPGIACSVTGGSGSVGAANVTDIAVACATGKTTILYSFAGGAAGSVPLAGLVLDGSGNLYGTTQQGGKEGHGTVFKLSPNGTETVLHAFGVADNDGLDPQAPLIRDSAGNLYGATLHGGAQNEGAVFKVAADGTETVLYSFGTARADGQNPAAGLVMDGAGNLYGTTELGGAYGAGTVFEVGTHGAETLLHSFLALGMGTDGQNPQAALLRDSAGNLYGTTPNGGAGMTGTVFKVSANGTTTVLYSFGSTATTDGHTPYSTLVMDSAGNLYGTTASGGVNGGARGDGVVFSLSAAGKETVLYSFGGTANDGQDPYASLLIDSAGNLFGTTRAGGANAGGPRHGGTVYKISPGGTETILYSFGAAGASDGSSPQATLVMDGAGNLYGTTADGGAHGDGTVFKID